MEPTLAHIIIKTRQTEKIRLRRTKKNSWKVLNGDILENKQECDQDMASDLLY